jgi:hypothetical protein
MKTEQKKQIFDQFKALREARGNYIVLGNGADLSLEKMDREEAVFCLHIDGSCGFGWGEEDCQIFFHEGELDLKDGQDLKWHFAKFILPPVQQSITELREQVIAECRRRLEGKEEVVLPDGVGLRLMAFKPTIGRFLFDVPDSYPMLNTKRFCDFMIYDSDQWEQTAKLKMAKTLLGI